MRLNLPQLIYIHMDIHTSHAKCAHEHAHIQLYTYTILGSRSVYTW